MWCLLLKLVCATVLSAQGDDASKKVGGMVDRQIDPFKGET